MITFASVAITMMVGLVSLVYGQTLEPNTNAELFEYKGHFYCYNTDINTEETIKNVVDNDWFYEPLKIKNDLISNIAEDGNIKLAKEICQRMIDNGSIGGW